MHTNLEFRERYKKIYNLDNYHNLNNELLNIVNGGFIDDNKRFILKKLSGWDHEPKQKDYINNTGYECFINSIHIDDYEKDHYLEHGLVFTKKIFDKWNSSYCDMKLRALISLDEDVGVNIKFHLLRDDESWLNISDLEDFKLNGICVVDSDNCSF